MEELELFRKRVSSYIDKAFQGGVSLTMFLDEVKLEIIKREVEKAKSINLYTFGGILYSDRARAIVSPYSVENKDFKIAVFEIIYNMKYYTIGHRNILGSILSLGIKRECIGDIVVLESKKAYFACCEEISDFLLSELHFIGKANISLKKVTEPIENVIRYEESTVFVSSFRLDVILAGAYRLSRSEALAMITEGLVSVNHVLVLNPSHTIVLNDEISVRHKGRVRLSYIGKESRSGRTAVTLGKRV